MAVVWLLLAVAVTVVSGGARVQLTIDVSDAGNIEININLNDAGNTNININGKDATNININGKDATNININGKDAGSTNINMNGKDSGNSDSNTNNTDHRPRDCVEARRYNNRSGVVTVYPDNNTPLQVYCDQDTDGGGWLVFQRRQDGSVDFYRNWTSYQNGFGDVSGEFWLGLDALHMLTSNKTCELRVDLMKFDGTKGYATYSNFSISDSSNKYTLSVSNFTGGNAGDSLTHHNNTQFSMYDADYNTWNGFCADDRHGAWWFTDCTYSHLNGRYKTSRGYGFDGVRWYGFDGLYALKSAEMKLRPV